MQKLFLSDLKHEEQTILVLKQMLANLDGSGGAQYYKSYFKIDPKSDINSLGKHFWLLCLWFEVCLPILFPKFGKLELVLSLLFFSFIL